MIILYGNNFFNSTFMNNISFSQHVAALSPGYVSTYFLWNFSCADFYITWQVNDVVSYLWHVKYNNKSIEKKTTSK